MKKLLKKFLLLFLILILAAILRLYQLDRFPVGLTWDEAALGYNAYSILKTAKDEYGQVIPLVFKSFGDWKPGFYVYLTVPSIWLLGLNEMAVRLPSAVAGIATVALVYFFTWEFFRNRLLAHLTALSLAVIPWHIHFSRGAWEANVAVFLTLLGIYCFYRSWFYFSAFSFGLSVLTYQGSKMIVPLMILGLAVFFRKELKAGGWRSGILTLAILVLLSLPAAVSGFSGGGGRLKVMSLFSYSRPPSEINQILNEDRGSRLDFVLFHNDPLYFARGILGRYFNHFSGKFLFFEGDWSNLRHSVPYLGVLSYFNLIFVLIGVYHLAQKKSREEKFLWYWLLVSPLPAALSRDSIQAVRSLGMVIPLAIIAGAGLYQVILWIRRYHPFIRRACYLLLVTCYLFNLALYLDLYYVHYPRQSSKDFLSAYKATVDKVSNLASRYQRIVFSQKWGQPYIFWLFYTQYPPEKYQKTAKLVESAVGDVGSVNFLDNIEFRPIYWPADRGKEKTLFIGGEYELPLNDIDPDQARLLFEEKFADGQIAFRVVETL